MRVQACGWAATALMMFGGAAAAEVVDSGPGGFTVRTTVHVAAPADKVYAALVQPARWWTSEHTFSGDARNLSLDAQPGGCFCETLKNGGGVRHQTVVYVDPGRVLRLRGPLGPLQGLAVDGALTFALKPAGDGVDLQETYAVAGYAKDGLAAWPAPVDGVLAEQLGRLKRLVETGRPDEAKK